MMQEIMKAFEENGYEFDEEKSIGDNINSFALHHYVKGFDWGCKQLVWFDELIQELQKHPVITPLQMMSLIDLGEKLKERLNGH